jgi:uroporphyrinogen decarboxylase
MDSRERIKAIIAGENTGRCGLWLGHPHPDTVKIYTGLLGVDSFEDIRLQLGDDMRWLPADECYKHPQGKPTWDLQRKSKSLSAEGWFSDCETLEDVAKFDWPDPNYLDFEPFLEKLNNVGPFYRASGLWSPFFHLVADAFGMENYFMKMYTHPEVVQAVTKGIVDFYLEANRRFFEAAGGLVDGFFFGNDFGSQINLLVAPQQFKDFIFPYFKQLTDLGHEYGYQVLLHSCGSIYRVIPDLISLGAEALHPIQAKAANMDAETLGSQFGGKVAFIGGIDTQDLLVNATPQEVAADVRRVKAALGPNVVISPSHEAILPNVPFENIKAMAEAALEN